MPDVSEAASVLLEMGGLPFTSSRACLLESQGHLVKAGLMGKARRCVRFQLSWDTSLSTLSHTPVRPDPLLLHKGPHSQAKAERNTDRSISTS